MDKAEKEKIIDQKIKTITEAFTEEDKEFNAKVIAKGRKMHGKGIPSIMEQYDYNATCSSSEEDEFDFTSKVLENF